jgi:hypothetical protein
MTKENAEILDKLLEGLEGNIWENEKELRN